MRADTSLIGTSPGITNPGKYERITSSIAMLSATWRAHLAGERLITAYISLIIEKDLPSREEERRRMSN